MYVGTIGGKKDNRVRTMPVTGTIDAAKVTNLLKLPASTNVSIEIESALCVINEAFDGCASGVWTEDKALLIGAWLAAHFHRVSKPLTTSRSVNGASTSIDSSGGGGSGWSATPFGIQALTLDNSGCLERMEGREAGVSALGSCGDGKRIPKDEGYSSE